MFGLRRGKRPRAVVTTTPKPTKIIRGLVNREGKDRILLNIEVVGLAHTK